VYSSLFDRFASCGEVEEGNVCVSEGFVGGFDGSVSWLVGVLLL
jgi:hypothetical protein